MLAIGLSLVAAACWGAADFAGGLISRRVAVPIVLMFIEGTGLLLALGVIAATGEPLPSVHALLLSAGAGISGMLGLAALYRGLAVGAMSLVAPVSACGVALPVVLGIATGDAISALVGAGLACTFAGVVLASLEAAERPGEEPASRAGLGLALLAALGFGGYFALADSAADESIPWLLATARLAMLPFVVAAVLASRAALPQRRQVGVLLVAGALDVSATGLYGVATTKGALSVVTVVGSLYPVATVLLARAVLSERLRGVQAAGVLLALTGVALIAAG